ncbi:MAG: tRNA (adenosine(37)-N6)-threonylcarbamoyltransferase complex dimerization subunit type 1 TsaB [Pseudomonadales bacterium]
MSPLILAIETSQQSCGVALRDSSGLHNRQQMAAKQHASLLLPMIKELLIDRELSLQDLNAISFSCGPGSFTGARIAASVTQGLAYAANAKAIPVSSLLALAHTYAQQHPASENIPLFVLMDAHMGEYYAACYQFDSEQGLTDTLLKDCLLSDQQLIDELGRCETAILLGNGIKVLFEKPDALLPASLTKRLQVVAEPERAIQAKASSVLAIAETAWQSGNTAAPEQALPVYLRERTAWKTVKQQNAPKSESQ